jgi:hypothetical protein
MVAKTEPIKTGRNGASDVQDSVPVASLTNQ